MESHVELMWNIPFSHGVSYGISPRSIPIGCYIPCYITCYMTCYIQRSVSWSFYAFRSVSACLVAVHSVSKLLVQFAAPTAGFFDFAPARRTPEYRNLAAALPPDRATLRPAIDAVMRPARRPLPHLTDQVSERHGVSPLIDPARLPCLQLGRSRGIVQPAPLRGDLRPAP